MNENQLPPLPMRLSRDKKRGLCGVRVGCDAELLTIDKDLFVRLSRGFVWDYDKQGFWRCTRAKYGDTVWGQRERRQARENIAAGRAGAWMCMTDEGATFASSSESLEKAGQIKLQRLKTRSISFEPSFDAKAVRAMPVAVHCPKCRRVSVLNFEVLLLAKRP